MKPFISFSIKIIFLLLLLFAISFSYFLLLITTEQKSLPFLTNKVEAKIKNYIGVGDNIIIGNIRVKQNNFKIIAYIDNVQLNHSNLFIEIPEIRMSFSIFDLILLQPSIDNIHINNIIAKYHVYLQSKDHNQEITKLNYILPKIINYKVNNADIKSVNLKILLKRDESTDLKINNLNLKIKDNKINISSKVIFEGQNINFNNQCYIQDNNSICKVISSEINPSIISKFFAQFPKQHGIKTKISSNLTFKSNNLEDNIDFILYSDKGSFDNKAIFQDVVLFNDFIISGKYTLQTKSFNIEDFSLKLIDDTLLKGSINIPNIFKSKLEVNLSLNNLTRENTHKLWPIIIPKDDRIKRWVLKHIKSFNIDNSNILMKFNDNNLTDIAAKFDFRDATILYDRYFPTIYDASGVAYFDKESMKIDVEKANVLNSKIKNSKIIIADFKQKNTPLQIKGQIIGRAEDLLKHVSYQSDFAKNIGNYINGYSNSYIDLFIPIKDKIELSNIYLQIYSTIKNINNNYVSKNSNLKVKLSKKINDDTFISSINLTESDINFKPLSIFKKKNINSYLSFNLQSKSNLLEFTDLKFILNKNKFLTGSFIFNLKQKNLQDIKLTHPDFALSYSSDHAELSQKLTLKGKKLDLNKLQSILKSNNNRKYQNNDIEIILDKLILANNIELNDVDVNLNCNQSLCINSFIEMKKGDKEIVNIDFKPYPIKKITKITGKISDISSITKGFNFYDNIIDGDLVIKAKIEPKDKYAYISGEVYNKKKYKISKGEMVKKISEDNSFSKIKDQLALEEQISFEDLRSEFIIEDYVLEIKNFILSNNYLGITARGDVGLNSGIIDIKGLVVPGYLINRLFGIGDLPIIKYISPILVGEEGGGIFAGRYKLTKNPNIDNKLRFKLNKSSIFAPGVIRNLFD